jgi:spermidine synthase
MLIALFTILFLGGGDTGMLTFIADTQDEVKAVMERDDRRKEALSTLKAIKKRTDAYHKMINRTSKGLNKALANDDVTEEDIDTIWYRYFAQRETYNRDMLDLRFQLRDQMTSEEWRQVFSGD